MSHLSIGVSAFRAAQAGLAVTGHNLANAATEGYHRQRVEFSDRPVNSGDIGTHTGGVNVSAVTRMRDVAVEQSISTQLSGRSAAQSKLKVLQRMERALNPSDYSLHSHVNRLFDNAEKLSANPSDTVLRQQFTSAASETASAVRDITREFESILNDVRNDIRDTVDEVNGLAERIAEVNREIRVAHATNTRTEPNSQLDQRDRLINELADLVDIDPRSLVQGADPLIAAGGSLFIGETTSKLSVEFGEGGSVLLSSSTGVRGLDIRSGKLGGLLDTFYSADLEVMGQFREWSATLLREIDHIQSTGISLRGPVNALVGHRTISDTAIPLGEAESIYPVESGELTVTVTDAAGNRSSSVITVDTSTDSLSDIVSQLDSVSGITASIDSQSGFVSLHADSGFSFDFSGRIDPAPAATAITGTSQPTFSGTFNGPENATWNVEVVNGGDIGVTEPVLLRVSDANSGEILGDFDFGKGYAANGPVELAAGVRLTLSGGRLNTGDSFSVRVTADSDETRLLASLGLQSMFTGNSLNNVSVQDDLARNPDLLAASHTGLAGDGRQIDRLTGLRSGDVSVFGSETPEERLASITGLSGTIVVAVEREISQRGDQLNQLEGIRDSVSGVDPNEELLKMLEYQRAFQAASRFVTTMDETLDDLLRLIR